MQVARADLERKQLDFALISDEGNPNKPLPQKKQGARNRPSRDGRKRRSRKN